MIKSKLQKVIDILYTNKKLQDLFVEFGVDWESASRTLVNDVLFKFDSVIQENTVYVLSEDPEEVIGKAEVAKITCVGDVGNSLNSSYFLISSPSINYYVWINTGFGTDPSPVGKSEIEVGINTNDDSEAVAEAIKSEINNNFSLIFSVTRSGAEITITNISDGTADDASEGALPTGFTFEVIEQGLDPALSITSLNAEISTALGLFPGEIGSPHKDYYRAHTSDDGTLYPYLLKWIYYCYKYFNEDQFFFHNLLNTFVPAYDNEVISSVNNLKIYFDGLGIVLDTVSQKINELYTLSDIDEIDENLLRYMAHLLGYQKEDFSIENISFRELIKNLTEIYKRKGTEYSFSLFFKLLGFDAEVREYYWDRDAQNSEGFAAIDKNSYLYYLTTQNPRTRNRNQTSDMSNSLSQQPIDPLLWSDLKDLRYFEDLLEEYSLDEVLGFKKSRIPEGEKFTYFKTNFINFKLTQFYTKQDLTAKDTDTILKYVKFLTPIYVSAFVEVVTTPWEEQFAWFNPEFESVTLEGNPGNPNWVDILLPYVFVTLRDYIPITLMPASDNSVVLAINGTQDLDFNGSSDSALSVVFGSHKYGISITGDIDLSTSQDLTNANFLNLKVDKGRGTKSLLSGTNCQTYENLVNEINSVFTVNSIDAFASISPDPVLFPPPDNYAIRITSNTLNMTSKIYLVNGIVDDLFEGLGVTPTSPVDGNFSNRGYQEFALFNNPANLTGLDVGQDYTFYTNVDTDNFSEIDVSGATVSSTTGNQIVDAINNYYYLNSNTNFAISSTCENLDTARLTNDKVVVIYRDVSSTNGRVVIMNADGTTYKAGISFSLADIDLATITASNDDSVKKFVVTFRESGGTKPVKLTVFNYEGEKLTTATTIESNGTSLTDLVSATLSNNRAVIVYNRTSDSFVRIFDISGEVEIGTGYIWQNTSLQELSVTTLGPNFIIGARGGSGGLLVYMKNDGSHLLPLGGGTMPGSTKTFDSSPTIEQISIVESNTSDLIVSWLDTSNSNTYYSIWDNNGSEALTESIISADCSIIDSVESKNNNIIFAYYKTNGLTYYKIIKPDGSIARKEFLLYGDTTINDIKLEIVSSSDLIVSLSAPNKGVYLSLKHIGDIASLTASNKLKIESIAAGAIWDDNVENYSEASDAGHKFTIDGTVYEFDNYSNYYRTFESEMFTRERNQYSTFFGISPNDDVIPLIQDSLITIFTILLSVTDRPVDSVDRANFYVQRNGYISRAQSDDVDNANGYMGKHTRHQDFSEALRVDPDRVKKEIDWPSFNNMATNEDDWSSWELALDYFQPQVHYEDPYVPSGLVVSSGQAYTSLEQHLPSGTMYIIGSAAREPEYVRSGYGTIYLSGKTDTSNNLSIIVMAGYTYPGAEDESSIYDNGSNTINSEIQSAVSYNNIYVVCGYNSRVSSYDGDNWSNYDGSGSGTGPYDSGAVLGNLIAYSIIKYSVGPYNEYLIVAGENGRVGSWDNTNWKNYDGSGSGVGPYYSNVLGSSNGINVAIDYNGILIVAGDSGRVSSFDGSDWKLWDGSGIGTGPYSNGSVNGNINITSVTMFNGFIVFGDNNGSVFSWDGSNWKNYDGAGLGLGPYGQNLIGSTTRIYSLAEFNNCLIVAGQYNRISSWDGIGWRYYNGSGSGSGIFNSSNSLLGSSNTILNMIDHNGYLIFGSNMGRIASYDGANWKNYDGSGSGVGPSDNMTAIGSEAINELTIYDSDLIVSGNFGRVALWGTL